MDVNQFARLQAAVQWATEVHQGEMRWNQATWFDGIANGKVPGKSDLRYVNVTCESACCIAGNVVYGAGDKFIVPTYDAMPGQEVGAVRCITKDNLIWDIDDRAIDLLGITQDEADDLFDGDNNIEQVVDIATRIATKYGYDLKITLPV